MKLTPDDVAFVRKIAKRARPDKAMLLSHRHALHLAIIAGVPFYTPKYGTFTQIVPFVMTKWLEHANSRIAQQVAQKMS